MRDLIDIFNDLTHLAETVTSQFKPATSVKCELCGKPGHYNASRQWICDACYANIFFQRTNTNDLSVSEDRSVKSVANQIQLELK